MASCKLSIVDYVELSGCEFETGRITSFALVDESVNFGDGTGGTEDITLPANWINRTYSADILVYKDVRGSYSVPSPTEIAGKGKQDIRVSGRKHEAIIRIDNVGDNWNHFNALNKSTGYKAVIVVGADKDMMFHINTTVNINAGFNVEEGLDSELDWTVSIKWDDIDLPKKYSVPAGIFED